MVLLASKRPRKPRLMAVSCWLSLAVAFLCGLELVMVRHVHSTERVTAATTGSHDAVIVGGGAVASKTTPTRQIPPPPKPQATSKHIKKPPPPAYPESAFQNCTILRPDDSIYQYGPWDAAPIVLERYQLLLFTIPKVGCTLLKQLCRRIMGYDDWRDDAHPLPHAPKRNGLAYLYDYPPAVADHMLTSADWTRAIFVREPLERLLSAYLDKGVQNQYMQFHCCRGLNGDEDESESTDDEEEDDDDEATSPAKATISKRLYTLLQCSNRQVHQGPMASELESQQHAQKPLLTFADFLSLIQSHPFAKCRNDPHWKPQAQRLDLKYWTTPNIINFIGHMETMADDTRRLLELIGAWDDYGANGWPPHGGAMFAGPVTVHHATDSNSKLAEYYQAHNDGAAMAISSTLAMAKKLTRGDYELIPGFVMPNLSSLVDETTIS